MYRKFYIPAILASTLVTACTHQKVEVNQTGDQNLGCQELAKQIVDIKLLKADIEDKRGFSGRNVGMALLFWPGIIVNEMNGDKAEELANERNSKLIGIFESRPCDNTIMVTEEQRYTAAMEKRKEEQAQKHSQETISHKN